MPQVIVKNVTASPITLQRLGTTIGVYSGLGDEVDLTDSFSFERIVEAEDLESYITAGDIVVNDGVGDLSVADALLHVSFESAYDERGLTYLENFAPEVIQRLAGMDINFGNILVNALALASIQNQEQDPDLSVFVDSFDNEDEIDPASSNYFIDEAFGYIGLNPGGTLEAVETLKSEFDEGTFSDTEASSGVGDDGSIRKIQSVAGGITTLEGFEGALANITDTGQVVSSANTQTVGIISGNQSLAIQVDFTGAALDETGTVEIDLGAGGVDVSSYEFIRAHMKHEDTGKFNYQIELEDDSSATWQGTVTAVPTTSAWEIFERDVVDFSGDIDATELRYIRIIFTEDAAAQTALELTTVTKQWDVLIDTRSAVQSFTLDETTVVQRIKMTFKTNNNVPDEPLYIGLGNIFETVLAVAVIDPSELDPTTGVEVDIVAVFDNPLTLVADVQYMFVLQTAEDTVNSGWQYLKYDIGYTDGLYTWNGSAQAADIIFSLYEPSINESVFIDEIEVEEESAWTASGTFTSQGINLGLVPDTLDLLSWVEDLNGDDITVRIRFASTEAGLSGATWSAYFTDPTGAANVLTGETPNQWYQYEITWSGGDTTSTSSVDEVTLEYSVAAGVGSATIISEVETMLAAPTKFIMSWAVELGTGTATFYISRDGKSTWQAVSVGEENVFVDFTVATGTALHLKAVMTGNAKLYGWAVGTDQPFI